MYVNELIGLQTVNTLPLETIAAGADHCDVALRLESGVADNDSVALAIAYQLMESLKDPDINIDLNLVMAELLVGGIDKFIRVDQG